MIFLELKEFTKGRIKATETVELSEQNSPPLPSLSSLLLSFRSQFFTNYILGTEEIY